MSYVVERWTGLGVRWKNKALAFGHVGWLRNLTFVELGELFDWGVAEDIRIYIRLPDRTYRYSERLPLKDLRLNGREIRSGEELAVAVAYRAALAASSIDSDGDDFPSRRKIWGIAKLLLMNEFAPENALYDVFMAQQPSWTGEAHLVPYAIRHPLRALAKFGRALLLGSEPPVPWGRMCPAVRPDYAMRVLVEMRLEIQVDLFDIPTSRLPR